MVCLKNKIILTAAIFFIALSSYAQKPGAGIGNQEVIVVKEYEATIQDAQKINLQPNIPEIAETKPKLDYTIPTKEFKDIAFEANPLKPLAVSKELLEKYNTSFVKIGFGSQLSPLVQLAYNDAKTKNLKFGIFYNHLSAYGFAIKNMRFSDDQPGVYLKYFPKTVEIGTDFTFRNYRTHFYGGDGSTFLEKDVRQVFRTYDALVYIKNAQKNKADIDIKQTLNFNYFQETYGQSKEWFVAGRTDFQKAFLQYHAITASFNFDVSQLNYTGVSLQRNIFTPMVGYSFNNDDWKAHANFGLAIDGTKPIFASDIYLHKRLYEHAIIAYASYTRNDQKNSLNSFAQTNNFIQNTININNSTVGDFGIGVKGTASDFSYNMAFHLMQDINLALFINDSTDMKRFVVVYDPNTFIYNAHIEGGYNVKEWLRLLLIADYDYYHLKTQQYAWHEPNFKATLRANYVWKNKISVNFDLFGITGSYARLPNNQSTKLNGTADINIALEYLFNKHLSFFIMGNNLAHIKYQQYYLYPNYGINGVLGGKFSF